ncbi:FecR family protein [Steroidobacter sp.]|uniref:FecR family protein n=1 Tax=Steroidobacter sp. TaxID=1978227 RepID=UPI001A3C97ED|nr:FecR domain-containing protein [Steroidobacter sp.]MBL8267009.1 FecR domain-containing protein [Steroidobacter sp.]
MTEAGNDETIRAEARDWLLRQALDDESLEHNEAFQRWYQASELNARAFDDVQRTWSDASTLQELRHLVEPPVPQVALKGGAKVANDSWRPRALAAGVALFSVIGLLIWTQQRPQVYQTAVGELRELALSDGSTLTLGGKTVVAIRMTEKKRFAELRSGEIFLSVHPDKQRPFFVEAGETSLKVVGTQFDVRRGVAQVEIGVLEGTVEVVGEREPQAVKRVHGGQQLVASGSGQLGEPQLTGPISPGLWRKGQRVYIDAPLREIVADANRYSQQSVELADASLGELKVSVSFRAENQQQMLNSLQLALPLTVERPQPDRIVLRAATR